MTPPLSRRRLLGLAAAAPITLAAPTASRAAAATRQLSFVHLHTGERTTIEYFQTGRYVPDALAAANRLLRDFRTGDVAAIDPALLDLLHGLGERLGIAPTFEVISGYRSPATNAALHRRSAGVASGSLHMLGRAIDIRVPGVPLPVLQATALSLRGGGVGYYPSSNFVHVDTGRVRRW
jgi:uncharacterized protein YcbK (DUF882 family)